MAKFFRAKVNQTFLKVHAKNLAKVYNQNWESYGLEETNYFKGAFPSSSTIKIIFSKPVVLIMPIIIRLIINMDNIRQEKLKEGPILSLNKRLK